MENKHFKISMLLTTEIPEIIKLFKEASAFTANNIQRYIFS